MERNPFPGPRMKIDAMNYKRAPLIERYRNFLPLTDRTPIVSLLEGFTPLIRVDRLASRISDKITMYVKYEGMNPTGSFKDRGMTMAVARPSRKAARRRSAPPPATPRLRPRLTAARAGWCARCFCRRGALRSAKSRRRCATARKSSRWTEISTRRCASCAKWRALPHHPRQLHQPVPHRGPEDRRVRDRGRPRACARLSLPSPSATPATSPPTGRDTRNTTPRR